MGIEVVEHTVPAMTLARFCEQYALEPIDLLKIDVEGHERQVLEGADWAAGDRAWWSSRRPCRCPPRPTTSSGSICCWMRVISSRPLTVSIASTSAR